MANEKTKIEKLTLESSNIVETNRNIIFKHFPEVRAEGGRIDFEKLKSFLGEFIETDKERFGMNWPGKTECFKTIQTSSMGTLRPDSKGSVDFENSNNIIIEGDNLEVLKLLQKPYLGKVNVIYIDPPYNTGNDFIYPDNYTENLQTYLEYTGQVDELGKKFGSNTESAGRYHSKWLSMMFPRLFLARNLLHKSGLICVSIDNAELHNLRHLMNEIFGEECFLGIIVRGTGQTTGQDSGGLGSSFDYVVVYSRSAETEVAGLPLSEEDVARFQDEDERGKYHYWQLRKTGSADRRTDRPDMYYAVEAPDGSLVYPIGPGGYESRWRCEPATYQEWCDENIILWKKTSDGNGGEKWWPYVKYYLEGRTKRPSPLWTDIEGSKKATRDLKDLFGEKVFDNPKPVELIKRLIQITPDSENGLVLDFFAGSGTTAQAVLELNKSDGNRRSFILVQLPEKLDIDEKSQKSAAEFCISIEKPQTIAEITKERVRRVIKKLNDTSTLIPANLDLGFKAFSLAESNFKVWHTQSNSKEGLAKQLELHIDHVNHERLPEDLLYEILLKSGFPLSTKVDTQKIGKHTVYSISSGMLLVCLEKNINIDLIKNIASQKPERVVCLDQGFENNDQLKANAVQIFRTNGIASFKTV